MYTCTYIFIPTHLSALNSCFLPIGKYKSILLEVLLWPSNSIPSSSAFKHPLQIFLQWPGTPVFVLWPYAHLDSASLTAGDHVPLEQECLKAVVPEGAQELIFHKPKLEAKAMPLPNLEAPNSRLRLARHPTLHSYVRED